MQTGTTTELNLADYFNANKMTYNLVSFEKNDEVNAAYDSGRCDAFTTDASGLYSIRLTLAKPDDHIVLPEIISKEPLGPVVRQGDDQWFNIVKWTHFALFNAEEAGVTQANIDEKKKQAEEDKTKAAADPNYKPRSPDVARLLGVDGTFGEGIGLGNDWVLQHHQADGQLRRDVRAQYRRRLEARDRPRPERAVVQGRHAIRPADPLI